MTSTSSGVAAAMELLKADLKSLETQLENVEERMDLLELRLLRATGDEKTRGEQELERLDQEWESLTNQVEERKRLIVQGGAPVKAEAKKIEAQRKKNRKQEEKLQKKQAKERKKEEKRAGKKGRSPLSTSTSGTSTSGKKSSSVSALTGKTLLTTSSPASLVSPSAELASSSASRVSPRSSSATKRGESKQKTAAQRLLATNLQTNSLTLSRVMKQKGAQNDYKAHADQINKTFAMFLDMMGIEGEARTTFENEYSLEQRAELIQTIGGKANQITAVVMEEEVHPSFFVDQLKTNTYTNETLTKLRLQLESATESWINSFIKHCGSKHLFEALGYCFFMAYQSVLFPEGTRSEEQIVSTQELLEQLIGCVDEMVNATVVGVDEFTNVESAQVLPTLVFSLPLIRMDAKQSTLELLAALMVLSVPLRQQILASFEHQARDSRHALVELVDELRDGSHLEFKASLMTLINSSIVCAVSVEERVRARGIWLDLGLESVTAALREDCPYPDLQKQLEVFAEELSGDVRISKAASVSVVGSGDDPTNLLAALQTDCTHKQLCSLYSGAVDKKSARFQASSKAAVRELIDVLVNVDDSAAENVQELMRRLLADFALVVCDPKQTGKLSDAQLKQLSYEELLTALISDTSLAVKAISAPPPPPPPSASPSAAASLSPAAKGSLAAQLSAAKFASSSSASASSTALGTPPPPPPTPPSGGGPPPPPPPGAGPPPPPGGPAASSYADPTRVKMVKWRWMILPPQEAAKSVFADVDPKLVPFDRALIEEVFADTQIPRQGARSAPSVSSAASGELSSSSSSLSSSSSSSSVNSACSQASILDANRSLAIELVRRKCPIPEEHIRHAILSADRRWLTVDALHVLNGFFPANSYEDERRQLVERFEGNENALSSTEQFLRRLLLIPNVKEKIAALLFSFEVEQQIQDLQKQAAQLRTVMGELRTDSIRQFLHFVFAVGTHLNNPTRKPAGFKFASLLKLVDVRSKKDAKRNLLHVLVDMVERGSAPAALLDWVDQLPGLKVAANVSASFVDGLKSLVRGKQRLQVEVDRIGSASDSAALSKALQQSIAAIGSAHADLEALSKQLSELMLYFGETDVNDVPGFFQKWEKLQHALRTAIKYHAALKRQNEQAAKRQAAQAAKCREKETLSKLMGTLRKSQVKGVAAALKAGETGPGGQYASIGRRRGQRSLLSPPSASTSSDLSRRAAENSASRSKAQDVDTLIADIMSANSGLRARRTRANGRGLIREVSVSLRKKKNMDTLRRTRK